MDDKKLAFQTAMTQMAIVAKEGLSDFEYQNFLALFTEAWKAHDAMFDSLSAPKKEPADKRFSLSLTIGFRWEG